MTKQASTAAATEPTPAFEPAIIVYGLDEAGKAHASAFPAEEVELATRAAAMMRMVALPVVTDACRQVAVGLPRGRVFSSGRAFCPFVKKATHDALTALGGEVPPAPEPPPVDPFVAMAAAAVPAASWNSLAVGQLVLAGEEAAAGGGWWPALVMELRPENLAVLRWRDWPDLPPVPRRIADLALLHPQSGALAGTSEPDQGDDAATPADELADGDGDRVPVEAGAS